MRTSAARDQYLLSDDRASEISSNADNRAESVTSNPFNQAHGLSTTPPQSAAQPDSGLRSPLQSGPRGKIHPQSANPHPHQLNEFVLQPRPGQDRLMNAREVASKLGVSERWVRDHTTRRSPKIRAVKLGPLVRYRWADVEVFMEGLETLRPSRQARFGV
jgi:predicted DNA-binding transcriptional regulator AlpA